MIALTNELYSLFFLKEKRKGIPGQEIKGNGRETYIKEVSGQSEVITPLECVKALLLVPFWSVVTCGP